MQSNSNTYVAVNAALACPSVVPAAPLPIGGLSRFNAFKERLPVGRETWRQLVLAHRAPQPIRIGTRCTVWRNDEVNAWLADPAAFTVKE